MRISDNNAISDIFSTKTPKKMLPKISINGINKMLFITEDPVQDKRNYEKNVLKNDIMRRNQFLQPLINEGHTFDIVVIKEEEHSYSTVIKISPEIRDIIMKHGDKLFISLSRCDISDRYHYKQCFHCQRLGHISTECPQKDDAPTCMYCAGIHNVRINWTRNHINAPTVYSLVKKI